MGHEEENKKAWEKGGAKYSRYVANAFLYRNHRHESWLSICCTAKHTANTLILVKKLPTEVWDVYEGMVVTRHFVKTTLSMLVCIQICLLMPGLTTKQSVPRVQEAMGKILSVKICILTYSNLLQMAEMKEEKRKQGRWWWRRPPQLKIPTRLIIKDRYSSSENMLFANLDSVRRDHWWICHETKGSHHLSAPLG